MIIFMYKIIFCLMTLLVFCSFKINYKKYKIPIVVPAYKIEQRLIWAESRGKCWARSHAGALGLYQIMPIVLWHYNKNRKTNYNYYNLRCPVISRKIYLAHMRWLFCIAKTKYNDYANIMIYVINSYNMGPTNTDKGKYKPDYLDAIIPEYWTEFQKNKKFLKRQTINGPVWYLLPSKTDDKSTR